MSLRPLLLLPFVALQQPAAREGASRPASAPAANTLVRAMTFNVRYGSADDGDDAWPKRQECLVATIRGFAPDILGVQEALGVQIEALKKALPSMDVYGQSRRGDKDKRDDEHCSIFVDRERFAVERHGDFWICESPLQAGIKGWDAALPRLCTWVVLREKTTSTRFVVFNTHLDHQGTRAREEGAKLIVERLKTFPAMPKLVLGDFNADESSPAIATMKASGLRDSYRALNPDDTSAGTFHAFRGKPVGGKIDYVFCDGLWEVRRAEIVRAKRDGRYPSDHFPVIAELKMLPL